MKVLYVATRWPWPIEMGRQRMIDQTLSFVSQTAEVHLLSFLGAASAPLPPPPSHIASARTVRMSGLGEIAASLLMRPGLPLQSHLFLAPQARQGLLDRVAEVEPDVIILDMARLFSLGKLIRRRHPRVRLVLDMDDRLSQRYQRRLSNKAHDGIGGTFAERVPGPVRWALSLLPAILLRAEYHLMARIERRAEAVFDAILMVSPKEAAQYNLDFSSAKATSFPPVIDPRANDKRDFSDSLRFVFIGNAGYAPNAEALVMLERIAARVHAEAGQKAVPFLFTAAGKADEGLALAHIQLAGFVPDLKAFLARDAVMIAPICNGTGIKTKIIDALEYGVPIVTTPLGAEGLNLTPGIHYLEAGDEDAFVSLLLRLVRSSEARQELGVLAEAAGEIALREHSREILAGKIRTVLQAARPSSPPHQD